MRGDGPEVLASTLDIETASPHTRGWPNGPKRASRSSRRRSRREQRLGRPEPVTRRRIRENEGTDMISPKDPFMAYEAAADEVGRASGPRGRRRLEEGDEDERRRARGARLHLRGAAAG